MTQIVVVCVMSGVGGGRIMIVCGYVPGRWTETPQRTKTHEDRQRHNGSQRQRGTETPQGTSPTETTNGGSMPMAKTKETWWGEYVHGQEKRPGGESMPTRTTNGGSTPMAKKKRDLVGGSMPTQFHRE